MSVSLNSPLLVIPSISWLLMGILICSHLLALVVVLTLLQSGWLVTSVLSVMILFSCFYYYRWHIRRTLNKSVIRAAYTPRGNPSGQHWRIDAVREADIPVTLLASSFMSTWLVILNFKDRQQYRYTLIIPVDAVSRTSYRRLRVILNTQSL